MGLLSTLFSKFGVDVPEPAEVKEQAPSAGPEQTKKVVVIRRERSMSESESKHPVRGIIRNPITNDHRRDLAGPGQERMRAIARYLWRQNPVAKRGIQNLRSFVTSEGFRVRALAKDDKNREKVQEWLDKWWKRNRWDELLSKRVETLCVEGEWFYWESPPDAEGISRLCLILPENIREVVRDPLDAERLYRVKLTQPIEFEVKGVRKIKHHLDVVDDCCLDGEIYILQINTLSGQTRGFSDLLVVSDWLDYLDTLTFTEIERVQFQRNFSWFVEMDTDDQDQILAKRDELAEEGPPGAGSIKVVGRGEKWDPKSPDLKLADSAEFIKLIKLICFGGLIMPEHYFSSGGDVNKATSANMDTPVFSFTRDRKALLRSFLTNAIRKGLRVARRMGVFGTIPLSELEFEVVSRDPDRSAYDLIGEMLQKLGQALQLGEAQGYISKPDGARAYRMAASGLGLGDFPGVDQQALDEAKAMVAARLESMKSTLEKQFPTKVPEESQQTNTLTEEAPEDLKKNLLNDLTAIVSERTDRVVGSSIRARKFAERMASQFSAELLDSRDPEGALDEAHVEGILKGFRTKFRDGFPAPDLRSAVRSGQQFVARGLEGYELRIPSGSTLSATRPWHDTETWDLYRRVTFATVREPDERVSRSSGGRRQTLGRDVSYNLSWWAADDFESEILARMKTSLEEGKTLGEFAQGLRNGEALSDVTARQISRNLAYAELRATKLAEQLMFYDLDEQNPGRVRFRFQRVRGGSGKCRKCDPLNGQTFSVKDRSARRKFGLPVHPGCGCIWVPVITGQEERSWGMDAVFIEILANSLEEAALPLTELTAEM